MSNEISKELLSEVLETKAFDIEISNSTVVCLIGNGSEYRININELEKKCIKWAIAQGYQFQTYYQCDDSESWHIGKCGMGWDLHISESCIEACQWILDNK
jgi:hypothetical protein